MEVATGVERRDDDMQDDAVVRDWQRECAIDCGEGLTEKKNSDLEGCEIDGGASSFLFFNLVRLFLFFKINSIKLNI